MEHKNLQSTPTLFALLTVWGAKKDIDRAAGLLQDSIDKYYGPLDAQVWDPILSPPPETGPWPSRGILLRQAVLLTREWEKGVEGPDVRVGRVLGEIPSNRVICLGWGVATASHPTQKAFVTGHRESSGFLMWAPPHRIPKGMRSLQEVKVEGRDFWEQELLKVGKDDPAIEERLAASFDKVLPFIREEEMALALPSLEPDCHQTRTGPRRL